MTPTSKTQNFDAMSDSQKALIISLALNDLQTKVSRHESLLITGTEHELPIPERIRNLEQYISNTKYWTRFVAGALIVQTMSFGGAVLWAAIRLLPLLERLAQNP